MRSNVMKKILYLSYLCLEAHRVVGFMATGGAMYHTRPRIIGAPLLYRILSFFSSSD